MTRAFDVTVIGDDLGGLCAALALQRDGFSTALIPRSSSPHRTKANARWRPSSIQTSGSPVWGEYLDAVGIRPPAIAQPQPPTTHIALPGLRLAVNHLSGVHVAGWNQENPAPLWRPDSVNPLLQELEKATTRLWLSLRDRERRAQTSTFARLGLNHRDLARHPDWRSVQELERKLEAESSASWLLRALAFDQAIQAPEASLFGNLRACCNQIFGSLDQGYPRLDVALIQRFEALGGTRLTRELPELIAPGAHQITLTCSGGLEINSRFLVYTAPLGGLRALLTPTPIEHLGPPETLPRPFDFRALVRVPLAQTDWPLGRADEVISVLNPTLPFHDGNHVRVTRAEADDGCQLEISFTLSAASAERGEPAWHFINQRIAAHVALLFPLARLGTGSRGSGAQIEAKRDASTLSYAESTPGVREARFIYPQKHSRELRGLAQATSLPRLFLGGSHLYPTLGHEGLVLAAEVTVAALKTQHRSSRAFRAGSWFPRIGR